MRKKLSILTLLLALVAVLSVPTNAHPGRTDERGGHYVRTPGWGYDVGSYHYHRDGRVIERTSPDGDTANDSSNDSPNIIAVAGIAAVAGASIVVVGYIIYRKVKERKDVSTM
jgi:hypothetical protein